MKVRDVGARHNISEQTYSKWKCKYGGMQVDEPCDARALAEENGRLKRIVADQTVQIDILKASNAKNSEPGQQAKCGTFRHAMRSEQDLAGVSCA